MEFRRINALPPYVFGIMDALKIEARRAGESTSSTSASAIPTCRRPTSRSNKLVEAVREPAQPPLLGEPGHPEAADGRSPTSTSGKFGVDLDPDTQVCNTIGAKEGFSHLMWVLLGPGDAALVPSPSYPIHIWGPILAGAEVRHVRLGPEQNFFDNLLEAWEDSLAAAARHRAVVPAQPDHRLRRPRFHAAHGRLRARARGAARARLRVRRPRLRRLRPAVDPAGAGRDRRRGRALHAHEVVLDGGMARRLPARQRRRGRARWPS